MAELGEFNVVLRRALVLAGNDPFEAVRVLEEGLGAARERGAIPAVAMLAKKMLWRFVTLWAAWSCPRDTTRRCRRVRPPTQLYGLRVARCGSHGPKDAAKHDYAQAFRML